MIYFITVNYHSSNLIAQLIQSIQANQGIDYRIIIINNSPEDTSIYQLKATSILILESGDNLGFGRACNLGLNWIYTQDTQAIVWIINPDTYLLDKTLEKVPTFFAQHPEVSIVGTMIYTPTGQIWSAGGQFIPQTGAILSKTVVTQQPNSDYAKIDWVSGCSFLINFNKFQVCPQFDQDYFLYYEDFDFCRRYANQGHLIVIANQLSVIHQPSSIADRNKTAKFQHSTYSYLLTLERYTNQKVLILRLIRIVVHSALLIPVKPRVAFGKLHGVWLYGRRFLS